MRRRPYDTPAAVLAGVYLPAVIVLLATKDFSDRSPLSLHEPARHFRCRRGREEVGQGGRRAGAGPALLQLR